MVQENYLLLKFSDMDEALDWVEEYPRPKGLLLIADQLYYCDEDKNIILLTPEALQNVISIEHNTITQYSSADKHLVDVEVVDNTVTLPLSEYRIDVLSDTVKYVTPYSVRYINFTRDGNVLTLAEEIEGRVEVEFWGERLEVLDKITEYQLVRVKTFEELQQLQPHPIGIVFVEDTQSYYHYGIDSYNLIGKRGSKEVRKYVITDEFTVELEEDVIGISNECELITPDNIYLKPLAIDETGKIQSDDLRVKGKEVLLEVNYSS